MRWTDFCHLTSSYVHPRLVGSRADRTGFRSCPRPGNDLVHARVIRFGGPHRIGFSIIMGALSSPAMYAGALLTPLSRPRMARALSRMGRCEIAKTAARSAA